MRCVGGSSHELYIYANTLDMYQNFVPKFPGRYLSSNVNITIAGPNGSPVSVPVGSQFQLGHECRQPLPDHMPYSQVASPSSRRASELYCTAWH